MDLGITQKEAARRIGADQWTIINWERGRTQPAVRFLPAVIRFLGHDPWPTGETIGDRIRGARRRMGLTQAEAGRLAGVSEGTVYDLEHGRQRPATPAGTAVRGHLLGESGSHLERPKRRQRSSAGAARPTRSCAAQGRAGT